MNNRLSFFIDPIRLMQHTAKKSLGRKIATRMSPFFVFSLATLLFLSSGCDSKEGQVNGIANTSSIATTEGITFQSDINSFLAQETEVTNFRKVMKNIHSLETFSKMKSKQIILFAANNQAFEKLGDAEKEKLLDSTDMSQRHQIFKNSLVLHDRSAGDWNGKGDTYGGTPINVDLEKGEVSFKNNQARILQKIQLDGGHLLFIVDNILT